MMNREIYIDLMEKVLSAYTDEHIGEYTDSVRKNGLSEHGFPRLTANLGILIAHGKKTEYKEKFREMMDLCCSEIPVARGRNGANVGNDFSVKEIIFCLLEVERAGIFDKCVTDSWREALSEIDVYKTYSVIAPTPPKPVNNWAAFAAASEQVRKYAGIGNADAFIENQIKSQLFSFDDNGMYRDPNEPMVYDAVTRLQLAAAYHFGYAGESRAELEEKFIKSADITLDMQSVTGEIPFGGRSHQFLHNETFFAALCEFYADFFKKRGDIKRAGRFRSAARLATENIIPWLEGEKLRHIKNYYPTDSMYGCEGYAYFDKYMVTTASWLYMAYVMADDAISEIDCPALSENGICETSEHFHKVTCRYNDYFVEFDTNADCHYDASGIGRVHRRGAPSAICLSVPFCKEPNYKTDIENPAQFSICAGIKSSDGYVCASDTSAKYNIVEKAITDEYVRVKFECEINESARVIFSCTLSDEGVILRASGNGEVAISFPLFEYDGETTTEISVCEKSAETEYKGNKCTYTTDGRIADMHEVYANRNGHYRAMNAVGENEVSLKIKIQ